MKKLFIVVLIVLLSGCCCQMNRTRDFKDDPDFKDYEPWWATNKVMVVTNSVGE